MYLNLRKHLKSPLFAFAFFASNLLAQNLPNIIPPSPQSANFIRYGEIPVNYSSGVPSIKIPIYTIEVGKIKLPISISYHSAGIKVQDISGPVGLGWVLNTGGSISRAIYGKDDLGDPDKDIKTVEEIDSLLNVGEDFIVKTNLWNMVAGIKESQSDRFFYSFNENSGVFRFDYINNNIIILPYSPIKIEKSGNLVTGVTFRITDIDGTIYIFDENDYTTVSAISQFNIIDTWNLTKVISNDYSDTIYLDYSIEEDYTVWSYSHTYTNGCTYSVNCEILGLCWTCNDHVECPTTDPDIEPASTLSSLNYSPLRIEYKTSLLTAIRARDIKVEFTYQSDRPDIRHYRLAQFTIKDNNSSTPFKQIVFENDTINCFGSAAHNNQRLKLKGITIYGENTSIYEYYSFDYNETIELPEYYGPTGGNYTFPEDYWGYFNNKPNQSYIPKEYLPSNSCWMDRAGDRNPDSIYMQAYILNKIHYPTGGWSEFEFESNRGRTNYVYDYSSDNIIGGLRIKKIKNYSKYGEAPLLKTFKYGQEECGYGMYTQIYARLFKYFIAHLYSGADCYPNRTYNHLYITGSAFLPLTLANNSPVIYNNVTEYIGDEINNSGKTVYIYESPPDDLYLYDSLDYPSPKYLNAYQYDRGTHTPLLEWQHLYLKGSSSPFKSIHNEYDYFKEASYYTGIQVGKMTNVYYATEGSSEPPSENAESLSPPHFFRSNTLCFTDVKKIIKKTEYLDGVSIVTNFIYNNENHLQPTKKTIINSKGDSLLTEYKYAEDLKNEPPYITMVNRHIWSPVIEQSEFNESIHIQTTRTNYHDWGNNIIAPSTIQTKQATNPNFETRINYHEYDNYGNIRSISKEGDVKTSYYWSYNHTYPVVNAINVNYSALYAKINIAAQYSTMNIENWITNPITEKTKWTTFNDKLRQELPDAIITTYTYKPLVGMTSETDPNGKTTYYEYDDFGRLQNIKDQDLNIIQEYKYHYMELE